AQWRARYDAAAADRGRLAELEALAAPTAAELAEHARLAERVRRDVDPLPLYERALAASPDHVPSLLRAGLLQLRDGQADAGAARLQRAVALDRRAARAALEELDALALDPDLAAEAAARASALRDAFAALADPAPAHEDRTHGLQPHDLEPDTLRGLASRLACEPRVARAWIARRAAPLAGAPAEYLVLLDWRGPVAGETAGLARLDRSLALPGIRFALFTGTNQRPLARQVRQACGEPVYRKRAGWAPLRPAAAGQGLECRPPPPPGDRDDRLVDRPRPQDLLDPALVGGVFRRRRRRPGGGAAAGRGGRGEPAAGDRGQGAGARRQAAAAGALPRHPGRPPAPAAGRLRPGPGRLGLPRRLHRGLPDQGQPARRRGRHPGRAPRRELRPGGRQQARA